MLAGAVRTREMEHLIQDGTPEQMEWHRIVNLHAEQERRAREAARFIVRLLEIMLANHNGLKQALGIAADRQVLVTLAKGYEVTEDHVAYTVELASTYFVAKYKPREEQ